MVDDDFQGLKPSSQPAFLQREDERLVQGLGAFVGNTPASNLANTPLPAPPLHAVFVRSPYAKTAVLSIDSEYASSLPAVVAIFTAKDFAHLPQPQVNTGLSPATVAQHGARARARNIIRSHCCTDAGLRGRKRPCDAWRHGAQPCGRGRTGEPQHRDWWECGVGGG
jgi:hypothetical protein